MQKYTLSKGELTQVAIEAIRRRRGCEDVNDVVIHERTRLTACGRNTVAKLGEAGHACAAYQDKA
jgi:hypothetical protein